jgi:membrane protein DedA with SNARE-associated domain
MNTDLLLITTLSGICALTFVDGLVLLGLVINGGLAFGACLLAYQSGTPIIYVMTASFVGVFAAEQLSFILGKYFQAPLTRYQINIARFIEKNRKRSRVPWLYPTITEAGFQESLPKINRMLIRFGPLVVIFGRWLPIASLVPASAAMYGMRHSVFVIASTLGCLSWVVGWNLVVVGVSKGIIGRLF